MNRINFLLFFTTILFFTLANTEAKINSKSPKSTFNIVVSQDGSGKYSTVQEAFNAVPDSSAKRTVIFIKNGVYKEKLVLPASKQNVTIIGESLEGVILTYNDYSKKVVNDVAINTRTSCSFLVAATGFVAENVTFENSAGPVGQAVAVMIDADKVIFKNCRFLGNQDTLFVKTRGRCYFVNCYIEGTTDFIFGDAIALFENCRIHSKKNSFVTAASTPQGNQFGFVLKNCTLTSDTAVHKVFLGRPWKPFSRVTYIECMLGGHILPEGWDNWRNQENEKTAFYAEYKNKGEGANVSARVLWSHQLTSSEVEKYTIKNIFAKDAAATSFKEDWIPIKIEVINN
jgi:pectinesterase